MEIETLLPIGGFLVLILGLSSALGGKKKKHTTKELSSNSKSKKISDSKVTSKLVFEQLKEFNPDWPIEKGRTNGKTGQDLEKELIFYLKQIFESVNSSTNNHETCNIANETVGIKLNRAEDILPLKKKYENLIAMLSGKQVSYSKRNFIVMMVGGNKEAQNEKLKQLENSIKKMGFKFLFIKVDMKKPQSITC